MSAEKAGTASADTYIFTDITLKTHPTQIHNITWRVQPAELLLVYITMTLFGSSDHASLKVRVDFTLGIN